MSTSDELRAALDSMEKRHALGHTIASAYLAGGHPGHACVTDREPWPCETRRFLTLVRSALAASEAGSSNLDRAWVAAEAALPEAEDNEWPWAVAVEPFLDDRPTNGGYDPTLLWHAKVESIHRNRYTLSGTGRP